MKGPEDRTAEVGTVIREGRPLMPENPRPVKGRSAHEAHCAQEKSRGIRRVCEEEGGDGAGVSTEIYLQCQATQPGTEIEPKPAEYQDRPGQT